MSEEETTYQALRGDMDSMVALINGRLTALEHTLIPPLPQHDLLYAALSKAQGAIQSAIASKENTHFNYKYADLDACWDACRKPLSDNELSVVQLPSVGEDGAVTLRTILGHASGQSIWSEYTMKPDKAGPQALASCISYLRRYTLCPMVGISQEDDDASRATKQPDEYERVSKIQMNEILVLANKLFGEREDEVLDRMLLKLFDGIGVSELPADTYDQVVGLLNNQSVREKAAAKRKKDKDKAAKPEAE